MSGGEHAENVQGETNRVQGDDTQIQGTRGLNIKTPQMGSIREMKGFTPK